MILQVCGDIGTTEVYSSDCYRLMLPSYKAKRISTRLFQESSGGVKKGVLTPHRRALCKKQAVRNSCGMALAHSS